MAESTIILKSQPGIKRDGTKFDGDFYTDGQWVRFQRGMPRKMGGYRMTTSHLTGISRGFSSFAQDDLQYCHSGSADMLERFTIDSTMNSSPISDRTPTTLVDSDDNLWSFNYEYDSSTTSNLILAHVAPNASSLTNSAGGQIFSGNLDATAALTEITLPAGANATGGIVALHPYLMYFGSDGVVGWSVAGTPTDLTGSGSGVQRVWGQKIVQGLPLRGSSGPSGLFWAYDAIIRATFVGGATVWQFDTIATDTSIISANSIVDYDGVFFWAGVGRFLMFNGVVREVPNAMNLNWFFDNLNKTQQSKVFAFKVPRFGEIWWCYPSGDSTECDAAVVYNVRENTWYDTILPASGRASGGFNNTLASPILTDATAVDSEYRVWIHEQGVDEIDGSNLTPIRSYFETADLSTLVQGMDKGLRITKIEPDFIQTGDMTVQVTGRANARAAEISSSVFAFPETASTSSEQIVMLKEQRRELRVKFQSDTPGGDYQMGQIIANIEPGDGRALN